jgi:LysR family glycine cleavage system transcriptional activator
MGGARFNIPSTSALIAFEATARLGGVIRASEELNTSQSAVSRHIRNLETAVGEKLFRRQGRGVVLTPEGQDYYSAVKSSLESLHAAGSGLRVQTPSVVIACTQEISHLLLMPVFPEIKRFLGHDVNLRILTCDYDMVHLLLPAGVDIIFEASAVPSDVNAIKVLDEEFAPVASPDFVRRFQRVFARHPRRWSDVPRLESSLHDGGWGTWTTWFRAHDCDAPKAPVQTFENYQYLLEAATNGEGMALGWNGLVNAYLESNRLVRLTESWLRSQLSLYAVATETGSANRYAVRFLKTLAGLGEGLTGARQVSPQRQPANTQAASFSQL